MESYAPKHSGIAAELRKRSLKKESHSLIQRGYTPKHSDVEVVQEKRTHKEGSNLLIQRG